MKRSLLLFTLIVMVMLAACATSPGGPTPIYTPIRGPGYGQDIPGQPKFPDLVEYWVVDNGCGFSEESLHFAHEYFEALNREHIAQVAVVCQEGISGGPSSASTWISEWLNHKGLGTMEDKRALAILIRPDVPLQDHRIVFNPNDDLYWLTTMDEYDPKHNAANYANANDFDGCLEYLAVSIDEILRDKWSIYGPTQTP
ncbi:MAG: hypothetical protein V1685_05930 [Parcubacteria group bacterium]